MRFYSNIKNSLDLKKLQDAASIEGLTAVGVTNSGKLYIWDGFKAKEINPDDACNFLDLSTEQVEELIAKRGDVAFEEEVTVEVVESEVSADEKTNHEDENKAGSLVVIPGVDEKLDKILEILSNKESDNADIYSAISDVKALVEEVKAQVSKLDNKMSELFLD